MMELGVFSKTVDKDKSGNFVVQMSHDWIEKRIRKILLQLPLDVQKDFGGTATKWKTLYRRHIVFVPLQLPSRGRLRKRKLKHVKRIAMGEAV